jgi:ATP dependent DNA ligase domain
VLLQRLGPGTIREGLPIRRYRTSPEPKLLLAIMWRRRLLRASPGWRCTSQRHITADATEEIKLDGYRALAVKSSTGLTLFSRNKKSLNRQFPYIVEALANLPDGTVVDGELVAIDDSGRPDFNRLQNFRAEASRIHYYVFDLLCWKNRDLTRLPLVERRALLKSLVVVHDKRIRISDYVEATPNASFRGARAAARRNRRQTKGQPLPTGQAERRLDQISRESGARVRHWRLFSRTPRI